MANLETVDLRGVHTTNTRATIQNIKEKLSCGGNLRVLSLDPHLGLLLARALTPSYRVQVEGVRFVKTVNYYDIRIEGA